MAKVKVTFLKSIMFRNKAVGLAGSRSLYQVGDQDELDESVVEYLRRTNGEDAIRVDEDAEPAKRGPGRPKKSE